MKKTREFLAAGIHRHYFYAPGWYRHFITSGILIALTGVAMLVILTAFRAPSDRAEASEPGAEQPAGPGGMLVLEVATKGELLPQLAVAIKEISEVQTVTEVRSGTRWLSAWNAEGAPESTPPRGYLIPIDIGAVDPQEYQEMVPDDVKSKLLDLGVGAIMSQTAAALRGITDKGNLQFGGVSIPVVGVVEDELTRGHEMLVTHRNADGFGIHNNRYLIVAVASSDDGKEVTSEIQKLVPPDAPVRVRTHPGSGYGDGPGLLSMAEIKTLFGEFPGRPGALGDIVVPQSWIDEHTALETLPLVGEFRCHKAIFPQVRGAIAEIEKQGLASLIDVGDFGGCFSPRFIRSGAEAGISRHSWGIAVDFNVSHNLMGETPTIDQRIVEIMDDWGFSWGGKWMVPDGMHFEFVRKVG
jgi:hypothetical protein